MATLAIDRVLTTVREPAKADPSTPTPSDPAWRSLYRLGGAAAASLVAVIAVAITVFVVWPPPAFEPRTVNVVDWYALLERSPWLGVLELDGLMLVGYALVLAIFLALYAALRTVRPAWMAVATMLAVVSAAVYFAANPAFSMLALSEQYAAATSSITRAGLLVSGQTLLAIYQGTPFDVSYVLFGVASVIVSIVMLRSAIFDKVTGGLGLGMGVLMLVPPTVGSVGVAVSLGSLVLESAWAVLVARRLFRLARDA
jgi:hypothetical protein